VVDPSGGVMNLMWLHGCDTMPIYVSNIHFSGCFGENIFERDLYLNLQNLMMAVCLP
jgi:hypothetical protein